MRKEIKKRKKNIQSKRKMSEKRTEKIKINTLNRKKNIYGKREIPNNNIYRNKRSVKR